MRGKLQLELDVQWALPPAATSLDLPSYRQLSDWAQAALAELTGMVELTIRVVGETESAELNLAYRGKSGPTNVLSFPFTAPGCVDSMLLGDLLICAPVVAAEALAQNKSITAHWAHMVVHGCLHLQGYDHQNEAEAEVMETLEARILTALGYADPYFVN